MTMRDEPLQLPEPPLSTLFADLARQIGTLVKQEFTLAQTEMTAKAQVAVKRFAVVLGGGLAFAVSLLVLLAALVLGLGTFMPLWAAALVVGLALALLGAGVAFFGLRSMRELDMKPRETIRTVMETKTWLQREMTR